MAKRISEQERRETVMKGLIAKRSAEMGLDDDKDIAAHLGISPSAFSKLKKKKFQTPGLILFCTMAKKFGWAGQEVCAIIGVPYTENTN